MNCKKCKSKMEVYMGEPMNMWYCTVTGCGYEEPFNLDDDVKKMGLDSPYPEHQKIDSERLATLTEFFEYLQANDLVVGKWSYVQSQLNAVDMSHEDIAYGFLGLDPKKLEAERKEMVK